MEQETRSGQERLHHTRRVTWANPTQAHSGIPSIRKCVSRLLSNRVHERATKE